MVFMLCMLTSWKANFLYMAFCAGFLLNVSKDPFL